jgi:hypothetical protein
MLDAFNYYFEGRTAHGTGYTAHDTRHTAHGTRHTAHGTRPAPGLPWLRSSRFVDQSALELEQKKLWHVLMSSKKNRGCPNRPLKQHVWMGIKCPLYLHNKKSLKELTCSTMQRYRWKSHTSCTTDVYRVRHPTFNHLTATDKSVFWGVWPTPNMRRPYLTIL